MPIVFRASGSVERFAEWAEACVSLPTATAFALFTVVGLPVDSWGAYGANDVAARCRRALWPSRRAPVALVPHLRSLLHLAERAPGGIVLHDEENIADVR